MTKLNLNITAFDMNFTPSGKKLQSVGEKMKKKVFL